MLETVTMLVMINSAFPPFYLIIEKKCKSKIQIHVSTTLLDYVKM